MKTASYWWILIFAIAWPLVSYLVVKTLFPAANPTGPELWGPFISFGLIGGISGFLTLRKYRMNMQTVSPFAMSTAYIIAYPIALLFSLLGPQALVAFPGLAESGLENWKVFLISVFTSSVVGLIPLVVAILLITDKNFKE